MTRKPCKNGCGRVAGRGRSECDACRRARYAKTADKPQPITVCEQTQPVEEIATALGVVVSVIDALAKGCPCDELAIVRMMADRLGGVGLREHGPMKADDERNDPKELIEEINDALVYPHKLALRLARIVGR